MTVAIRPETDKDRKAVWGINKSALGGEDEANLVNHLRDGGYLEVSLVAEADEEIVGHILFSQILRHKSLVPSLKSI